MSSSNESVFRSTFRDVVSSFVDQLFTHPDVFNFALTFLTFLIVLLIFVEVGRFMMDGLDFEAIVQSTLMVFITLGLFFYFEPVFDTLHETFDNYGLLMLKVGTGNSDPFYLYKWVNHSFKFMHGEEISLWDMAIGDIIYAGLWYVVSLILQICMYMIGSWAVWNLALGKILGIVFVPMLVHPGTRALFDGWMRFTLGSLFLLVILRAVGVLVALGINAQFKASGIIQCGHVTDFQSCTWQTRNMYAASYVDYGELIVTMIISILLIVSSLGLTASIVGNVGSPSKAASRGLSAVAKGLAKTNVAAAVISKISGK
ncbi:hypothetical protein [Vibrio nigripulchritudo]|uniref:hypothetical protein n=1 Tax=Vibrio nigripulchritudo TaxID=28173 RepID=UPI00066C93D1|nr:hypothetical protein [Vibrio nigripulchritudo]